MKQLIVSSLLVMFFLTPSLALMNISDSHPLDGSVGTQSIHVNAFRGMVYIRDNNVLSEWYGVLDYKNALLVAKLYSKMACVLAKMDQAAFPTLDDIKKALDHQVLHWQLTLIHVLKSSFCPLWGSPSVARFLGSELPSRPRGARTNLVG
ncbi:gastrokine-3-like isoform X2 [Phyllostomus hastatus]|uniref:gastrokine-3-like isoform X2 n=1 Tax=Phyllostomus hastatus TaxID=9423 RepID=UPI001E67F30D|nr:gastrokine-3-like isoform X2 [Phyllostomus hastatus]